MIVINIVRFGTKWPTYPPSHYLLGFSIATVVHLTVNYFTGLYEREPRVGYRSWLPRVSTAMAIAIAVDGLVSVIADRYLMPRINLATLFLLGSIALTSTRHLTRHITNLRRGSARLVLLGSETERSRAKHQIATHANAVHVVAECAVIQDVVRTVNDHAATDVLLLDLTSFASAYPEPLTQLELEGIGVHQRITAAETLLGLRVIRQLGGIPFIRLKTHAVARHQYRLKRLFDLAIIIIFSPLLLLTLSLAAIYTRIAAGAHVLYHQQRVGLDGKTFALYKFRTMRLDAEQQGFQYSHENDPRVIKSMKWLRTTRLDELPQVWNVLQGKMSLVGPRPERPEFVRDLQRTVPGYSQRHQVPPGITGLAQVYGHYDTEASHKIGYDLQYLVNWSIVLDIQILARTIFTVLRCRT